MKSVHITNYYHKNSGGISTAYNKLLEAANRHRRFVRLIVPGEHSEVEEVGEFGRIYYVRAGFSPIFDRRYRVMMPWKTYMLDKAPIKTILRQEQPDIIEIGEKYTLSLMAGLLRKGIMNISEKRPMLVHLSCERMDDNVGSFISNGPGAKWFSRRFMGIYHFPMFDFHLANSDYTANEMLDAVSPAGSGKRPEIFRSLCWRFLRAPRIPPQERVFVHQCGVDHKTFSASKKDPAARRRLLDRLNLSAGTRLLLYAGRISPEKNISLLPKLMRLLERSPGREYTLLVAGDGPGSERFRKEVGQSVRMLGHVSDRSALAEIYANSDIFVHPNPREPFGIAPLEAMASGLPVVAPNAGGLLSYASSENAWLVDPNPEEFVRAINDVFDDEVSREKKIAEALNAAARYTWEASTDGLFAAYDRMYAEFIANPDAFSGGEPVRSSTFGRFRYERP